MIQRATSTSFMLVSWLSAGDAIDELAQDVGMPGVAGGFLDQVRDDPAQRGMATVIGDYAQCVVGRGGGGSLKQRIRPPLN